MNYPLTTYDLHGCSAGLEVDPANEGFKTELENLKRPPRSAGGGFFGPEILGKLALNPATAPLLSQPDFIHMIQDVNKNPNNMSKCVPLLQPLYRVHAHLPADPTLTAFETVYCSVKHACSGMEFCRQQPHSLLHPSPVLKHVEEPIALTKQTVCCEPIQLNAHPSAGTWEMTASSRLCKWAWA